MPTKNDRLRHIFFRDNLLDTSQVDKAKIEKIIGWLISIRKNVSQCHDSIHKAGFAGAVGSSKHGDRLDLQITLGDGAKIPHYETNLCFASHVCLCFTILKF